MKTLLHHATLQPNQGAIFRCPLCEWSLGVAPVVTTAQLDAVFGPGVMEAAANTQRLERVERDLYDHLTTHTILQWVTRVRELERELAGAQSTIEQMRMDMREG